MSWFKGCAVAFPFGSAFGDTSVTAHIPN